MRSIRAPVYGANVKPALFSANSESACQACNGADVIYTDLAMMAGVSTVCEDCEGKRFQSAVLNYKLGGKNIAEVLDMPVTEALQVWAGPLGPALLAAKDILQDMNDVGLAIYGSASR